MKTDASKPKNIKENNICLILARISFVMCTVYVVVFSNSSYMKKDAEYLSGSLPEGKSTGISSILSVCRKYGRNLDYKMENEICQYMSIHFVKFFNQISLKTDQFCQSRFFERLFAIMVYVR